MSLIIAVPLTGDDGEIAFINPQLVSYVMPDKWLNNGGSLVQMMNGRKIATTLSVQDAARAICEGVHTVPMPFGK